MLGKQKTIPACVYKITCHIKLAVKAIGHEAMYVCMRAVSLYLHTHLHARIRAMFPNIQKYALDSLSFLIKVRSSHPVHCPLYVQME